MTSSQNADSLIDDCRSAFRAMRYELLPDSLSNGRTFAAHTTEPWIARLARPRLQHVTVECTDGPTGTQLTVRSGSSRTRFFAATLVAAAAIPAIYLASTEAVRGARSGGISVYVGLLVVLLGFVVPYVFRMFTGTSDSLMMRLVEELRARHRQRWPVARLAVDQPFAPDTEHGVALMFIAAAAAASLAPIFVTLLSGRSVIVALVILAALSGAAFFLRTIFRFPGAGERWSLLLPSTYVLTGVTQTAPDLLDAEPQAALLLKHVAAFPLVGVAARYTACGLSRRKGDAYKNALIEHQYVEPVRVAVPEGVVLLLGLTDVARSWLHRHRVSIKPMNGSLEHAYWQQRVCDTLAHQGWNAQAEVSIDGHAFDVVATNDDEQLIVEVETGKSRWLSNLAALTGLRAEHKAVLWLDPTSLARVKQAAAPGIDILGPNQLDVWANERS